MNKPEIVYLAEERDNIGYGWWDDKPRGLCVIPAIPLDALEAWVKDWKYVDECFGDHVVDVHHMLRHFKQAAGQE